MAPPTLPEVIKDRESLAKRVVRLQSVIVAYDPNALDLCLLELDSTQMNKYDTRCDELYYQTYKLCKGDEFVVDRHEADFDTIQGAIKSLQLKLNTMIRELKEKRAAHLSASFKLDRVKLPMFNGNFSEWQSFRDLFIASVHKNRSLSGAEKLIHLKSSLTGDAASIVSSFQATETNYAEAWDSVLKRYDVKREIVFAHIMKFDDLKAIKEESAQGLRLLSDTINECVRSLKVLNVPVDQWDLILIYMAIKKLDNETRKQWSLEQDADLPTLDDFVDFIEARARALQDVKPSNSSSGCKSGQMKKTSSSHSSTHSSLSCVKCSKPHHLHQCNVFANSTLQDRRAFVFQHKLCFNCLFPDHSARQCKMQFSCKQCGLRHHTLIHLDQNQQSINTTTPVGAGGSTVSSTVTAVDYSSKSVVLLGTLLLCAQDSFGNKQLCRVFVDPGSESNFVSEHCVQRLGLRRKKTCVSVSGIGGVAGESAKGLVNLQLHSRSSEFTVDISALVYPRLTANLLPRQPCKSNWPHLQGLNLSDPEYYRPNRVDILLGASVAGSLMLPGIIHGPPNSPVAQLTHFGWMLSGTVDSTSSTSSVQHKSVSSSLVQVSASHACCRVSVECLQDSMEKFWKLEELESSPQTLSSEEQQCEDHFLSTHVRNSNGG